MENLSKLSIKMDDIIQYGYIALRQFPKSEKFVLATRIADVMWEIAALIDSACNTTSRQYKLQYMGKADLELKKLKVMVRNSMKLEFLPFKKYEYWSGLNVELGRMIGAWMRQVSQR